MFGGPKFEPGSTIRFTYMGPETVDRYKEVLVLHPNWRGKMHGIDLKRLTPAEMGVIRCIFDPKYVRGEKIHPYPLVNDILRRMDPIEDIKNPISFYHKFVKVFLRDKDAYRTYYPNLMSGVTTIQKSAVEGHLINPKPLFHK